MLLLGTVTLCCAVVAGTLALFEPGPGQALEKQVSENGPVDAAAPAAVRVIGAPFVPNVKPSDR